MRPLYSEHKDSEIDWQMGNTGLWYDKFCNQWCRNREKSGLEAWTLESFKNKGDGKTISPKQDWIDGVAGKPCGNKVQLEQAVSRLESLLAYYQQAPISYILESDFVTGLGREHPVENGFAWHHTLGTPYLAGSSVKGMVRAWAEEWDKPKPGDIKRIFGSESKDDKNFQSGSVIFLDAIPTKPTNLKADIMTPHYGPYYQDKDSKTPPADWHSPNPIPFLVVEKGQTFSFGVLPRHNDTQGQLDCEMVKVWLKDALCWTGAGAKTAVGYGRFVTSEQAHVNASALQHSVKSEVESLLQEFRQVSKGELKNRTQGFVDKLKRLKCSVEEKQQTAKIMKDILNRTNIPKINKLNAYIELERLEQS